ncbi:hypothetical protein AB0N38_32420 [Micromonospora aurantiaca]|uniref:ATP-binding protein n=2 Tax=Micromonospora TaxID=1873 RepID=A0ABQ6U7R4_9ACTN|nr:MULTISPECIES: hypothetical protein [Micromonospora]KAB1101268.1 hypothetical protein F6X54_31655 [Micromonospora aurantiaca]UFN92363.1 hypothetical protein LF814_20375 [Micromonospora aurantiaca]
MDSVRMPFGGGADSAPVRRAVREVLVGWQATHVTDDALTVITELVHNVIRHTGAGGRVELTRSRTRSGSRFSTTPIDHCVASSRTRTASAVVAC